MSRARLVIAEDDRDIRDMVTDLMTSAGYETDAVDEGLAALNLARSTTPDLLLLDIAMPGLTGLEVCRLVKSGENSHRARVLLMSADTNDESVAAGLAAGADGFWAKPFSPRELLRRVRALLDSPLPEMS